MIWYSHILIVLILQKILFFRHEQSTYLDLNISLSLFWMSTVQLWYSLFYFPFSATCTGNPDLHLLLWQATQHDLPGVQCTAGPLAGPRGQERSVQGVRVRAQRLCHIVCITDLLSTKIAVLSPYLLSNIIG